VPRLDELIDMLPVDLETLALPIGAMRAADVGSFIPLKTYPM
jgi:hypothetical protein